MQKSWKIMVARVVFLVHFIPGSILLAQVENGQVAKNDEQVLARQAKFSELLKSVKSKNGEDKKDSETIPAILDRTQEGYIRFLMMPRSSHIEVAKTQDWKPEDVADTFIRQWKGLLNSESATMELKRNQSLHRQNYSIIRYGSCQTI